MTSKTIVPLVIGVIATHSLPLAGDDVPPAGAFRGRMVAAYGRIEPEGGVVQVAAPYLFSAPQVIQKVLVKEGEMVREGQILAILDNQARLEAALANTKADLSLAQSRLALATIRHTSGTVEASVAAVDEAQADLDHAERELARGIELGSEAAIARMDIDRWRSEVAAKTAQREQCRQTHAALRDNSAAEVATATAVVESAKAAVALAEAETAFGVVRAPRDGRVLKTFLRGGELATSPLLELGDTGTMNVLAEVYETEARFVKLGVPARITSDALAHPLTGKVTEIGWRVRRRDAFQVDPSARADGRVVEVTVRLDDPGPVAGMTNLEVEVVIGNLP